MKRKTKKYLSMCLSLALTAASIPFTAFETSDGKPDGSDLKATATPTNLTVRATESSDELFSLMTISNDSKTLSADGKQVGKNFGGFSISENNDITVNVGGKEMTLEEAETEIGCQVIYDKDGNINVISPFQTSKLIVKSNSDFDSCGAVSVEEKFKNIYLLGYESPADAYRAYLSISENESIDFVEPDTVCQTLETTPEEDERTRNIIESWGISKIGTDEFCERLTEEKEELPEVRVAVIDTGIYANHNIFKGRILDGGKSFVPLHDAEPTDENGHGTHCAGIICSSTNDNVKILPVQVLNEYGQGEIMGIYCGIMYAVEQGVDIISLSLGGYGKSNLLDEAVAAARKKGITVCVAAGNNAFDVKEWYANLASNDDCVVVSSVDSNLNASDFTCFGSSVDFAAPGEEIKSAGIDDKNSTANMSGTSMATPFVAACFADVLSYDINYTSDELYNFMKANAIDILDEGFDNYSGWGFVNLRNFRFSDKRVETPVASVEGGFYEEAVEVELSCRTEKATIYYTLDGSKPSVKNGKKYDGKPIKIEKTSRLRFFAECDGVSSHEDSVYYSINYEETAAAFVVENGIIKRYDGNASVVDIAEMVKNKKLPKITGIGAGAFYQNGAIEEVILPDTVKTIDEGAFCGCYALKKVVSEVETVKDSAFSSCMALEEFTSESLKSVGEYAFQNCCALEIFNGKNLTVIPDFAFTECPLNEECFNLKNVTKIGDCALSRTAISGAVDVSNAEKIGSDAFSETLITEIKFSDTLERLPDKVLLGCIELKKISAPAVTEIGEYALALCKDGFTEENMVECDIDFSKVKTVDPCAFSGYVFDKPVSFDSLDAFNYINAFADAYGEALYLPTLKSIMSMDISFTTFTEYSCDFKFNVIYLENATDFIDMPVSSCKAIVIGDNISGIYEYSLPYYGNIFTYSENELVESLCENNGKEYGVIPAVCVAEEEYTFFNGQEGYINAYAIGEDCTSALYKVDANGKETLIVKNPVTDVKIDTSISGENKYIIRQTDADNNVINEKELTVKINDITSRTIKANEVTDIPLADITVNGNDECFINYKFIPEKTDTYTISANYVDIDIYENGEKIDSVYVDTFSEVQFDFEKGKEYELRLTLYVDEFIVEPEALTPFYYFTIKSSDNEKKCISGLIESSIVSLDGFDGTDEKYKPEITISDGEYELVEGVDYEVELDEPVHFGANHIKITGIGNYFGVLLDEYQEISAFMIPDEEAEMTFGTTYRFIPENDGIYKFTSKPLKSDIDKAVENGAPLSTYSPVIDVLHNEEIEIVEGFTMEVAENLTEFGSSALITNEENVFIVKLKAGEVYTVSPRMNDSVITVTEGHTIADCKVDYKQNYNFKGEAIIPEITLTGAEGETLRKGIDYNLTYWNNDKVGLMYAYIEGIGKYTGAMPLMMCISDDDSMSIENADGKNVISIKTDNEIFAVSGLRYALNIEEDTAVTLVTDEENADVIAYIYPADTSEEFAESISTYSETLLRKGKYVLFFENICTESASAKLTLATEDDLKLIDNAEIKYTDTIYADGEETDLEIIVEYDGKTLTENQDYYVTYTDIGQPGFYTAVIEGMGEYAGSKTIGYEIKSAEDKKLPELSEGTISIKTEEASENFSFEWTPEKEKYNFSCNSGRYVYLNIYNQNKEAVYTGILNRKLTCDVSLNPNETYIVNFSAEIADEFEVSVKTEHLLSDCIMYNDICVEFDEEETTPQITFTDGDYTLVEGVDYVLLSECLINDIGLRECVYQGCGKYFGEVTVPYINYKTYLPEDIEFDEISEGFNAVIGGDKISGTRRAFRFTSDAPGLTKYMVSVNSLMEDNTPAMRSILFRYNENGIISGVNEPYFELGQGDTAYFIVVNPYVFEVSDQITDSMTTFRIDTADEPAETTTEPVITTSTSTSSATTPTTTTTIESSQTSMTTSTRDNSTDSDELTETTTTTTETTESTQTSTNESTTTTTTTTTEGNSTSELPETGLSKWYDIISAVSAAMVTVGGIVLIKTKKEDSE